jgi:phytanoyl-CoA hydroxylase
MQDASHASAGVALVVTAAPYILSAAEREGYARDGYLALRDFISRSNGAAATSALGNVLAALDALLADVERIPRDCTFYESLGDARSLKQITGLHNFSPALSALATEGPPAALASALLGERAELRNVQFFSKPPSCAVQPTPPHQDSAYFLLENPNHAVTLWLALDDVDEENGAIEYVRGSHAGGLLPHVPTGVLGFSRGLADTSPAAGAENIVQRASPGDLLVHHGLTIHGAGANLSAARQRRALGFIYFAHEAVVDIEAKAAYEERLKAHLKAQGRL